MSETENNKLIQTTEQTEALLESALIEKLKLTWEQRIVAHENARQLVADLSLAGEKIRAKSKKAS